MIIWLSGPTGSGKTCLATVLSQVGYSVVREEAPPDLFQAFSTDPSRHCEALQEALIRSRHAQYLLLYDKRKVVCDRSAEEDISVFCRMYYDCGYLDAGSLSRLQALAAELDADLPSPDLIVYLSVSETVLRQRMAIVGHPKPVTDTLRAQLRLYDEWISRRTESVVKIDNSKCRPGILTAIF